MSFQQPPQPAYILHSRPFRDSSLILELLTPGQGRIGCVARGARRDKQRRQQSLQPFSPLLVTLMGRGDLKTLGPVESAGSAYWLRGRAVYGGLYVNELLMRLLPVGESQYQVFAAYQNLLRELNALAGEEADELLAPLRRFELALLAEMGNCPSLDYCAATQGPLEPTAVYRLERETGFVPVHRHDGAAARADEFSGRELLELHRALQGGELASGLLTAARRLSSLLLAPLLGEKPLQSRELFKQVYGKK
ncbi:DNA repair protein RecO [Microbulbifer flavimaris]|uniref:DNA repair protein RecO n=1 Tax=Microbulbifer flavimaris TaxID=1781068 RepID=A0ABX4I4L4_9GAMM|nr:MULTISPECIES: DNA repair protein RecO [Microbulbifer]KUJ84370.1 DNA repair protein RecO [Microbulbifer sp. ZGT114]PCO06454.1 DNA repair protein RecO [Microbulbifer flavimaris]